MNNEDTSTGTVTRILVRGLFGYLTYDLDLQSQQDLGVSRASILYGDNGSGKTTILKLVFNLLSSRAGKGEKTTLARIPFRHLAVYFSGGSVVQATRPVESVVGAYTITIARPDSGTAVFDLTLDSDGDIKRSRETDACMQALKTLKVQLVYLADDRSIRATLPSFEEPNSGKEPDTQDFERWVMTAGQVRRRGEPLPFDVEMIVARLRSSLREEVMRGSNIGENNANTMYLDLLERLTKQWQHPPNIHSTLESATARIAELATTSEQLAKFGIAPPMPANRLLELIESTPENRKPALLTVLEPYLDGVNARLNAQRSSYETVSTFVEVLGRFFASKTVEFSIGPGLRISVHGEPIKFAQLSSGEKHLLMLLCSTVIARERATLFLIDEPELSLNIKWQRILVDALISCSANSNVQFLLASHSLELLSKHKSRTLLLNNSHVQ